MRSFWKDVSVSAVVAGFVAVLVGVTSSIAIVFAAAQAVGATPGQTASWIWALGLGNAVLTLGLSLWYRQPVLTAWSTPGAALIAATQGIPMADAVGAFVVCAVLITVAGYSGLFARLMDRIPMAIASALLAGVLTRFALDAALSTRSQPLLVIGMVVAFLAGRRWWPRYAVPGVLVAGTLLAAGLGLLRPGQIPLDWTRPEWVTPHFSWHAVIGLGLPLFVVTMASQNLPGVAVQRGAGYDTPVSPTVGATGLASLLLAPFGGYALNLAAITAALCMGPQAHEQPERRYTAAVSAGVFYLLLGLAGGAVAGLLGAFPKELVIGIAGLALLGTIGGGLASALQQERHRDAALLTYVVTLSGINLAGIGSAFWGVVVGALALLASQRRA